MAEIRKIISGTESKLASEVPANGESSPIKSILWVDDNPKYNSYLMENLKDRDIQVTNALSTADAMRVLSTRNFDRIITDMARGSERSAGLDLIEQIRQTDPKTPIDVFCGHRAAKGARSKVMAAGGNGITASATELFQLLGVDS